MPILGDAVVEVRPDLRPLDKGLGAAEGAVKGFVGKANASLATLGAVAAGAGLVGGLAYALADATNKAADLNESLSKVKTTFGRDSKAIVDSADDLAARFGLVKRESIDGATSIGLIGQAAGLTNAQSARLGAEMGKLAADFSSFFNVTNEDALLAFRSGLVGEAEPLRRFGVLLNEDAVKAEALRLGLTKSTASLSEQAKVLARVSLIRGSASSKKAEGDLERTADSAKNQLRKFTGDLENFKTDFGQNFIKPMTEGLALAREMGAALEKAFGGKGTAESAGETASAWVNALRQLVADPAKTLAAGAAGVLLPGRAAGVLGPEADARAGVKKLGGLKDFGETNEERKEREARGIRLPPSSVTAPTPAEAREAALAKAAGEKAATLAAAAKREKDVADFKREGSNRGLAQLGRGIAETAIGRVASFLTTGRVPAKARPVEITPYRTRENEKELDRKEDEKKALARLQASDKANARLRADAARGGGGVLRPQKLDFGSAQVLQGAESFASFATAMALENDLGRQQLAAQLEAKQKLGEAVEQLKELVRRAAQRAAAVVQGPR